MKNEAREYFREVSLVEAIRYEHYDEIYTWVMKWDLVDPGINIEEGGDVRISVSNVEMRVELGQWVVRDIAGEFFYPMDDEKFKTHFTDARQMPF